MATDNPNIPKWAVEPLVNEASPLQPRTVEEAATRVNETGSLEDYDSDISDDDMDRYPGSRGVPRGCFLDSLIMLNVITCFTALGAAASQALVISNHKNLSPESIAIRCYTILFCFLVIFAELEWTSTVREMFALHSWIPRGILYSFIGVLVLEEEDEKDLDLGVYAMYIEIIAWMMVSIGALYFVMGLLCIQRIRDKRRKRYKDLVAHFETSEALRKDHEAIP